MRAMRLAGAVVAVLAVVGTACSSSGKPAASPPSTTHAQAIEWRAPPDPLARARAAGLTPETAESFAHHVHAHLDVFVNGQGVTVPAGLGINIHDPGVHLFSEGGAKAY